MKINKSRKFTKDELKEQQIEDKYNNLVQKIASYSEIIKEEYFANFSRVFEREIVQLNKECLRELYQNLGIVQELCYSLSTKRIMDYQMGIIKKFWKEKYDEKLEFKHLLMEEYKQLCKINPKQR